MGLQRPLGAGFARVHRPSGTYLSSITISNFALVDSQELRLSPGFNVITGESGSGKSVLLEALSLLLGSPVGEDVIRPPATTAVVEGTLSVAPSHRPALRHLLKSLGLPDRSTCHGTTGSEDDVLKIKREVTLGPNGGARSRCFLNGTPTSVRVLREVGRALVDVNGQHATVSLRDAETQLDLLDRLGGLGPKAAALRNLWTDLITARAALRSLDELADEHERAELQALVDDVASVAVEPGEDVSLRRRLRQLDARRDAAERCRLAVTGIGGGDDIGLSGLLLEVERHVRSVISQEERLAAIGADQGDDAEEDDEDGAALAMLRNAMSSLDSARRALEDASDAVEKYSRRYHFSASAYAEAASRLQELQRLMKTHGVPSVEELLGAAVKAGASLDSYYQMVGRRGELEARVLDLEDAVAHEAATLGLARRQVAAHMSHAVGDVLAELSMKNARFDVRVTWEEGRMSKKKDEHGEEILTAATHDSIVMSSEHASGCGYDAGVYRILRTGGLDTVEFLFAAGPEEPLRPLAMVASGGEAARLMLALKACPPLSLDVSSTVSQWTPGVENTLLPPSILVLDEIDSGIGSRLGQAVGRILLRVAGVDNTNKSGKNRDIDNVISSQILCVSHLPQVAAHAEHHICVRKAVDAGGRLVTRFERLLDRNARLGEVSAMLGLSEEAAENVMRAAEETTENLN